MATTLSFSEDLQQRYEACRWRGRVNYCAAYLFLILAVSCSAVATLSVAVGWWPKPVNAVLAALPGLMYLANRQFRFEERSKWWFEKFYVVEGLYRGLVRERRDEAEISKELTLQSRALAARWPGFGEAPGH
jgi:uncharacterized membrane protein YphA (DoxX/SURF4 family)